MIELFETLARRAGAAILAIRSEGFDTLEKADASPVTRADRDAERIILEGLRGTMPDMPVVAEEEASAGLSPDAVGRRFILVDPLDGTREFVKGGTDFTVNIAFVEDGVPVAGVVYAPALDECYVGSAAGAFLNGKPIATSKSDTHLRIVASKSHRTPETDAWIDAAVARFDRPLELVGIGSSLKFCILARGEADLYPRLGRTMEWDTAAGDAVLRAAGGATFAMDGEPLTYGKPPAPEIGEADAFANGHFYAMAKTA